MEVAAAAVVAIVIGDGDDSTKSALIKYAGIELQNGAPK